MIPVILSEVHRTWDYVEFPLFPRDDADDYSWTSIGLRSDLLSLSNRALRLHFTLYSGPSTSVASQGFDDSSIQMRPTRGRTKITINLDQVELLCSARYTWYEIGDACIHGEQINPVLFMNNFLGCHLRQHSKVL